MLNANALIGAHDVLFVTLDTLRFDVADEELRAGRTPHLAARIGEWEKRHTPGSFTYAAHHAFFAGFLPTPCSPGPHPRLFATAFPGSETTDARTAVFDAPNIVEGFAAAGYHTLCIGGVGFFNLRTPLGRVLPGMFRERHWREDLGVTDPASTEHQVALALERVFLVLNVAALHQPNCSYLNAEQDTRASHAAALRYVDGALDPLFERFERRGPTLCLVMSDHGTLYGEDGHVGHRCAHPVVWEVPYAEFLIGVDRRRAIV